MQQEPCNIFQCEEPCQWDQWTEWSGCSCGIRSEHRNRTLKAYASGGHDKTCDLDAGALGLRLRALGVSARSRKLFWLM